MKDCLSFYYTAICQPQDACQFLNYFIADDWQNVNLCKCDNGIWKVENKTIQNMMSYEC